MKLIVLRESLIGFEHGPLTQVYACGKTAIYCVCMHQMIEEVQQVTHQPVTQRLTGVA